MPVDCRKKEFFCWPLNAPTKPTAVCIEYHVDLERTGEFDLCKIIARGRVSISLLVLFFCYSEYHIQ